MGRSLYLRCSRNGALNDARATHSQSPPQPGNFVEVRGRRWLVEEVETGQPSIASLSCIDDDAQGDELRVIWDVELDARLLGDDPWSYLARDGADDAEVFAAFLRTIKWRTATAADRDLFQTPFRAGIRLDAYQLAPLNKALRLPWVNLLIADHVGLGKTIEAGLVLRELLLRRRSDFVLLAAPPFMTLQWQDELESKVGLSFRSSTVSDWPICAAWFRRKSMVNRLALHHLASIAHRRNLRRRFARPIGRVPGTTSAPCFTCQKPPCRI